MSQPEGPRREVSEAILDLIEAQSWEQVARVLEAHRDLWEELGFLLSATARWPEASDYEVSLAEDLGRLLHDDPEPVRAARGRPDVHWTVARQLFGSRMDRAWSLYEQYQTSADPDLLDQARRRWDALLGDPRLASTPPGYRLLVADGVGAVKVAEYAASGDLDVLDGGLGVLREALDTTAPTSRFRPRRSTNYAAALLRRFHATAETSDLVAGLQASREALEATDPEDPLWPGRANNVAAAISLQLRTSNDPADLDDAVRTYDDALTAAPTGSPARTRLLHGRGLLFHRRHAMTGDIEALQESIRCLGEAADHSEGLPDRPLFLGDLGIALSMRDDQDGDAADLDRSVDVLSEVLGWPGAGPDVMRRNAAALAIGLDRRHARSGSVDDLRREAQALRAILVGTDPTDERYVGALREYGACLRRFVDESTPLIEGGLEPPDLRSQVGRALWELYEITRSDTVRDRALTHLAASGGRPAGGRYCDVVLRTIDEIGDALLQLYGRDLSNTFNRLGRFLQKEILALVDDGHMDTDLQPVDRADQVLLPGLSALVTRHIRYVWDYVVFIGMSHKVQNIRRRQVREGSAGFRSLLYLRGADYQLAVSDKGAGVGLHTAQDRNFKLGVLDEVARPFALVQAMSPGDLHAAMTYIGSFLSSHGNYLSSVAEFARAWDGGLFLNPATWRAAVDGLLPSASLVLVYVSNQSNGLLYELERLVATGLEEHAILVLDEHRFGSRASFFATQQRLVAQGVHLYESVVRDASAVDDPAAFERIVQCFPHTVALGEDPESVRRDIEALIPAALRPEVDPPREVPFEFHVNVDDAVAREIARLRRTVAENIRTALSRNVVLNWAVLVLHLQLDVFLDLASGELLDAASSTARYAAVADFMRAHASESATPEQLADLDQCGNLAMNIAYDAFAMGEANDYSDRRGIHRELAEGPANEIAEILRRSVEGTGACRVHRVEHHLPEIDPAVYDQLAAELLGLSVPSGPPDDEDSVEPDARDATAPRPVDG